MRANEGGTDAIELACKSLNISFDEKLARIMSFEWQTAAQIQRLSGGGTLEVVKALDRLWDAGRIDREAQALSIGVRRKGGGAQFHRIRYRRKPTVP
ncbi:hypothetical protein CO683_24490 [Bradyrhizobium ottawaense]|uniref:hypothetical protein n=1 Tax=Bradyrhizobium TaxID=374 RepID=UPI000BE8E7A1|nr:MULTISPECIES: hypothetical protein [Bradyrhizobium]MDA9392448.1 hypothetical protein [Bradyrhizobium sp. CCBAU 45394]PDT67095.1 hypothetical protein CO683_24490 [Bradyrhizobium ottawaense]